MLVISCVFAFEGWESVHALLEGLARVLTKEEVSDAQGEFIVVLVKGAQLVHEVHREVLLEGTF